MATYSPPAKADIAGTPSNATAKAGFDTFWEYANTFLGTGATLVGHRNKARNGNFPINQRNYVSGAATSVGQYTLDCWKVTGTGGITWADSNNKRTVTIPASQTIQQVIRGTELQTGTYVLSWEGTAQGRIAGGSYGASGAVTASVTGGTNTTIEFNTGTVANIQFELGTTPTPYELRMNELELCQKSYYRMTGSGVSYSVFGLAWCESTTVATGLIKFPVRMYARPTTLDQSGTAGHYGVITTSTFTVCSSVPVYTPSTNVDLAIVTFTVASGLTANACGALSCQFNGTSGYLGWSCDL